MTRRRAGLPIGSQTVGHHATRTPRALQVQVLYDARHLVHLGHVVTIRVDENGIAFRGAQTAVDSLGERVVLTLALAKYI